MHLNISQIRLVKHLSSIDYPTSIKYCEDFLVKSGISLSSARKYIHYLNFKKIILIEQNSNDKRSKLVSLNPSKKIDIDSYI